MLFVVIAFRGRLPGAGASSGRLTAAAVRGSMVGSRSRRWQRSRLRVVASAGDAAQNREGRCRGRPSLFGGLSDFIASTE